MTFWLFKKHFWMVTTVWTSLAKFSVSLIGMSPLWVGFELQLMPLFPSLISQTFSHPLAMKSRPFRFLWALASLNIINIHSHTGNIIADLHAYCQPLQSSSWVTLTWIILFELLQLPLMLVKIMWNGWMPVPVASSTSPKWH